MCTSEVLILTTQLLEEVSHTVEKVDYTEAKGSHKLIKNRYADKLPSELRNTYCTVALVSLKFHNVDDGTRVRLNPTQVQGSDYINANFVKVRIWYTLADSLNTIPFTVFYTGLQTVWRLHSYPRATSIYSE